MAHFSRGDKPPVGSQWGPWTYVVMPSSLGDIPMLQYKDRPSIAMRLEGCTSAAEVLDWIMQLYKRPLMHEGPDGYASIGYLIEALDDLLSPQRNLCSGGQPKTMDVLVWLNR